MTVSRQQFNEQHATIQRLSRQNETLSAQNALLKELVLRMVRIPASTVLAQAPATAGPASGMDVGSLLLGEAIGFTIGELIK